jgi:uncharacterized protein YebE (UPF0316 family)
VLSLPLQPLVILAAALALDNVLVIPSLPLPAGLPAWALPIGIFVLLSLNSGLDALRMLSLARGQHTAAWLAGFGQSVMFVTAVGGLFSNVNNPWNVAGYAGGVATGTVLGILIEARLAPGRRLVRIISSRRGPAIAAALREHGWGATEFPARGQDGMVSLIWCHVRRREAVAVTETALDLDPEAFITAENVRLSHGGWRA